MRVTLPFLTADIPGTGGRIKHLFEDFVVDEIPAYDACGEGTHTYFLVEKRGLTTMQAARDIGRALGLMPRDIGYAGLKDARALTRQWFSVEHVDPERIKELKIPKIRIDSITKHRNKLKIGHLRGNRFQIRLRDCKPGSLETARAVLDILEKRGIPNYFGPQRFGARGDTWVIGKAMMKEDHKAALDQYLGKVSDFDEGHFREARMAYDAGDLRKAHDAWPYPFREERRAIKTLVATEGNVRRAWFGVDPPLKRLFMSAYQSYLFNRILADRLTEIDKLKLGDLAYRHQNEAVFTVEDVAKEQPRCDAFEISPSGPLYGYRMTAPKGEPGEAEAKLLVEQDLKPEDFKVAETHRIKGARRPLRFHAADVQVKSGTDLEGPFLEFGFVLPKGCYATCLLREILKGTYDTEGGFGEGD